MKRLLACLAILLCVFSAAYAGETLVLATTTSTADTGLLDYLVPAFEKAHGATVKVIAVGSGEALAMGARGAADVLLVHSKAAEDEFMAQGNGLSRDEVMYNDFIIVGPAADPAGIKGLDAVAAFKTIAEKKALFLSRADKSGTHSKELSLWKKAAVDPESQPWRLATGQGMGETARIASEKQGYTLIDRGTFLALAKSLKLVVLAEKSKDLLNTYRVIVVDPVKHPGVHVAMAKAFAAWLVSPETQEMIGEFGKDKFGQALFTPDAAKK